MPLVVSSTWNRTSIDKFQKSGFTTKYENDEEYAYTIRMLPILVFLKTNDVYSAFEDIVDTFGWTNNEKIQKKFRTSCWIDEQSESKTSHNQIDGHDPGRTPTAENGRFQWNSRDFMAVVFRWMDSVPDLFGSFRNLPHPATVYGTDSLHRILNIFRRGFCQTLHSSSLFSQEYCCQETLTWVVLNSYQ